MGLDQYLNPIKRKTQNKTQGGEIFGLSIGKKFQRVDKG